MTPLRIAFLILASFSFGAALGLWWARRGATRGQGTLTDIRGNESWTRKGAAWCIGLSFVVFIVCAWWPTLANLADKYIGYLMAYAGSTFGIGKAAEEGGSALSKWLDKLKGGSNATTPEPGP